MFGACGFASVVDWLGRSYRFARRAAAPTTGKAALWTSDGSTLKFTNEAGTTTNVATASSLSFDDLASGTNTTAAMLVGTGGSLGVTGSGTINATTLGGATFAAPGAIGGGTAGSANFRTTGILAADATTVPLLITLAAANTANMFEIRNSAASLQAYITQYGEFFSNAYSCANATYIDNSTGVSFSSILGLAWTANAGSAIVAKDTGLFRSAAGVLKTTNGSSTDYFFLDGPNLALKFGGTSASYPALYRSGSGLRVLTADLLGAATFNAYSFTAETGNVAIQNAGGALYWSSNNVALYGQTGNTMRVTNASTGSGAVESRRSVRAKTADYTVAELESGAVYTNDGAGGAVDGDLPSAPTVGSSWTFTKTDAQAFTVTAPASTTIRLSDSTVSSAAGVLTLTGVGSSVTLVYLATNEYYAVATVGGSTVS